MFSVFYNIIYIVEGFSQTTLISDLGFIKLRKLMWWVKGRQVGGKEKLLYIPIENGPTHTCRRDCGLILISYLRQQALFSMRNQRYLLRVISYFLPVRAFILTGNAVILIRNTLILTGNGFIFLCKQAILGEISINVYKNAYFLI